MMVRWITHWHRSIGELCSVCGEEREKRVLSCATEKPTRLNHRSFVLSAITLIVYILTSTAIHRVEIPQLIFLLINTAIIITKTPCLIALRIVCVSLSLIAD